jgi:hypothetical protein
MSLIFKIHCDDDYGGDGGDVKDDADADANHKRLTQRCIYSGIRFRGSPHGICSGRSGSSRGFFRSILDSSYQSHCTNAAHSFVHVLPTVCNLSSFWWRR